MSHDDLHSAIEDIRTGLAELRDRLDAVEVPDAAARVIIEAAAGTLITALVALNHPDVRLWDRPVATSKESER